MFKYIALLVVIFISLAFYDQYANSLLSEEQKQVIQAEKKAKNENDLMKRQAKAELEKIELERVNTIALTPWSDVKSDQYAEKFLASKTYLWFLLLLVPTFIFRAIGNRNNQ